MMREVNVLGDAYGMVRLEALLWIDTSPSCFFESLLVMTAKRSPVARLAKNKKLRGAWARACGKRNHKWHIKTWFEFSSFNFICDRFGGHDYVVEIHPCTWIAPGRALPHPRLLLKFNGLSSVAMLFKFWGFPRPQQIASWLCRSWMAQYGSHHKLFLWQISFQLCFWKKY